MRFGLQRSTDRRIAAVVGVIVFIGVIGVIGVVGVFAGQFLRQGRSQRAVRAADLWAILQDHRRAVIDGRRDRLESVGIFHKTLQLVTCSTSSSVKPGIFL